MTARAGTRDDFDELFSFSFLDGCCFTSFYLVRDMLFLSFSFLLSFSLFRIGNLFEIKTNL